MGLKTKFTADEKGIFYIWKQIIKELSNLSSQLMEWANNKFVQSINGKGLSTNDYTNEDKLKLAGIENGAQKHIAPTGDEVVHALGFTPADAASLIDYTLTVTENGASGNTLKSYVFSQQGATIATINIPKDLVVSSGSVVVGNWVDGVFTEDASGTGKAVKLVIANQSEPIYINVQDLVDVYTAEKGATEIQLAISNNNEISATLVKSVRDKIDNAIPKVSGAAGKVPQFKADGSIESSSFEIKKSVPADAVFTDHQTDKDGHYKPSDNDNKLSPDTSVLRDPERDMAFIGAVNEDEKGHVISVDTVAILALTNEEIQAIIDQATAEMAAEME